MKTKSAQVMTMDLWHLGNYVPKSQVHVLTQIHCDYNWTSLLARAFDLVF